MKGNISINKYKQVSVNKEVQTTINIIISIKRTSKICLVVVNEFLVLLLGIKKPKAQNKTREKYMLLEERKQNLAETDRESYCNQE